MHSKFGQMLYSARAERNLTVRKIAAAVGCTPSFVSEIENGHRMPPDDPQLLNKIADVIGVDSEAFAVAARLSRVKPRLPAGMSRLFGGEKGYALFREAETTADLQQSELEKIQQAIIDLLESLRKKG